MANTSFLEKLTLPLDSQHQCFLLNVQLLCTFDCRKLGICTKKTHFTITILNFGSYEVGVACTSMKLFYGGPDYYRDG